MSNQFRLEFYIFLISAQPTENCCLVVTFSDSDDTFQGIIDGDLIDLSNLGTFTDEGVLRKVYQISDNEVSVSSIEDSILTRIAVK